MNKGKQPGIVTVSARTIFNTPLSKKQKTVLSRIARRQMAGDDSSINYTDIPPLTDAQLKEFRRRSDGHRD